MDDVPMPVRRREVYTTERPLRALPHPDGKQLLKPRALGGPELPETDRSARGVLSPG